MQTTLSDLNLFTAEDMSDVISAISSWEGEFAAEKNHLKFLLDLDFDEIPIPDESRDEFNEFVDEHKKQWRARVAELNTKEPARFEKATNFKGICLKLSRYIKKNPENTSYSCLSKISESFSVEDSMDILEALLYWSREAEHEFSHIKHLNELDINKFPVPDEKAEEFQEFFNKAKKNWMERLGQLRQIVPERDEKATTLRAKFFVVKRYANDRLVDALFNVPLDENDSQE